MEYYSLIKNNTLSHHGIKDMSWGHRRAEWYPIDKYEAHLRRMGYSDRAIKKKMRKAEKGEAKYQKQLAKKRAKNLEKAQRSKSYALKLKKEKEDIIKRGDIEKALERIDDFSNEELKIIVDRNQAKINVAKAKTDAMISKLSTVNEVVQKATSITSNSVAIYNNVAKVANAFGDYDLPILGQNNNNSNSNNSNNSNQQNQNNKSSNDNLQKEQENRKKKIDKDIEDRIKKMDKAAKKNAKATSKTEPKTEPKTEQKTEPKTEQKTESKTEHWTGTVEDDERKDNSRQDRYWEKASKAAEDIIIDTVWKDVTDANVRKGQEYVTKALPQMNYPLLEMKKK